MVMARSHGVKAWLVQRLSAVYMAGYLVFFLLWLIAQQPHDYVTWRGFMIAPVMGTATVLFFLMLLMHAWIGMRDVVMDYVHPFALRFALLIAVGGGLFTMGVWVVRILLGAGQWP